MTHGAKYFIEVMRHNETLGTTAVVLGPFPTMSKADEALDKVKGKMSTLADPPRGVPHLRVVKVMAERYLATPEVSSP
jgi:hypothetical protein